MRLRYRAGLWVPVAAVVVIAAHELVYALVPQSVLIAALERGEGGPQLVVPLTVGALGVAALAATVLWLAVVAVRERLALEGRRLVQAPRLRFPPIAGRAAALFLVTSLSFALTESYLHWRAGLGWHGFDCLVGPVHRDAIPILGALSVLAASVHGALEHLLAWTRRAFAQLASVLQIRLARTARTPAPARVVRRARAGRLGARGPPGPVFVSVP